MKTNKIIALFLVIVLGISCGERSDYKLSKDEYDQYLSKGKNITAKAFDLLSSELKAAIQEGGIEHSIPYCHLNALLMIDSISDPYGVTVNRTSLRSRNPENRPGELEKEILVGFEEDFKAGKNLEPVVIAIDKKEALYCSPIFMKPLCLNCHGIPEVDINQTTMDLIKLYYPDDRATGYKENNFRGMWTVRFKRDS